MEIEPFLVRSSVIGVLAQRLVRMLCPQCRVPYHPTAYELTQLGIDESRFDKRRRRQQPQVFVSGRPSSTSGALRLTWAGPLGLASRTICELVILLVLQVAGPVLVVLLALVQLGPLWLEHVQEQGLRAWRVAVPRYAGSP